MQTLILLIALLAVLGAAWKFRFVPFGLAALAEDRGTPFRTGLDFVYPIAAAKQIYTGALVVINSGGYLEPGTTATGKKAVGVAQQTVDNTDGSNGDQNCPVRTGVFRFVNYESDPITLADAGAACYIVDDQTVARTNGSNTRSVAGIVEDVDTDGVWVHVHPVLSAASGLVAANNLNDVASAATARANIGANVVTLQLKCADITSASANVYRVVSPVAGTIKRIQSVISGALATGDATLTGKIGATAITNGAITITQSGSAAGDVDAATPTALNAVVLGDVISLTVGGTNTQAREAECTITIET